MKNSLVIVSILLGILFIGLAIFYWMTPAKDLPHFFPGFDPALAKHHYKHGIGAFLLGLASFAYAWFGSAKKSPQKKQES